MEDIVYLINLDRNELVKVEKSKMVDVLIHLTSDEQNEYRFESRDVLEEVVKELKIFRISITDPNTPRGYIYPLLSTRGRWRGDRITVTYELDYESKYQDITYATLRELRVYSILQFSEVRK